MTKDDLAELFVLPLTLGFLNIPTYYEQTRLSFHLALLIIDVSKVYNKIGLLLLFIWLMHGKGFHANYLVSKFSKKVFHANSLRLRCKNNHQVFSFCGQGADLRIK